MDEFEKMIRSAKTTVNPREDFVEKTMSKVSTMTPRKKWALRILIPSGVTGVVIVAALLIMPQFNQQPSAQSTPSTQSIPQSNTIPAGTDNASLESDMNGIDGSMNQESADQSSATSSLNDSSQQVDVPSS